MTAHNLDKLPEDARALVALFFDRIATGWTGTYMIEVKLDDPVSHLLEGGDGLHRHGGCGSRCYANYYNNPEWAVIHVDDEDWQTLDKTPLLTRADEIISAGPQS